MTSTVLVVSPTGDLGGRIAHCLLRSEQHVRGLVRPGADHAGVPPGVVQVPGDLTDPPTLLAACQGADVVVASATAIGRMLAGARRPGLAEVDRDGMLDLVRAAELAGVRRFVHVSYAGVEAGIGFPLERAKRAVEDRLAASAMQTVAVRPDAFHEVHLAPLGRFDVQRRKVAVFGRGETPHRWVATQDVAELVARLAVESAPPEVVEVGGPESLTRNEAIAVAEQLLGTSIKVQRMPLPLARLGIRALRSRNAAMASIFGIGVLFDTVTPWWDDAPLRERGIAPTSTTGYLERQVAEVLGAAQGSGVRPGPE